VRSIRFEELKILKCKGKSFSGFDGRISKTLAEEIETFVGGTVKKSSSVVMELAESESIL